MLQPLQTAVAHSGRAVQCLLWRPEGGQDAVVIAHGYNGHGQDAAGLARALARQGIAAVALSFCGGSTRDTSGFPSTAMTVCTERDDVLAVLDWTAGLPGIRRVFLYGESMGGLACALAAAAAPDRVAGLGLLYPALCIPEHWAARYPAGAPVPDTIDFWGLRLGRAFVEALRGLDVYALLPAYRGPVLLMHGLEDPAVPFAYSERAAALYPRAELHPFPGEGHGFSPAGARAVEALLIRLIRSVRP